MLGFLDIDALSTAFGSASNDVASALIVVTVLCLFAAIELFRAR
ncbi:hypothetical protein [Sphingomonas sp.]|nr:hypothetical protein [Sphingomonas sp.]HTG38168.1 hypothetical protein [Sphingomonas sp.]